MIEDGDRHHGAQSACLENGIDSARDADDHVVIEFVLDDDVDKLGTRLLARATNESRLPSDEKPLISSKTLSPCTGFAP